MEQAVRKIALLGMGTVGGGVYEIIERQKEEMPFKIGAALEVVKVLVRNKAKYADRIPAEKLTDVWEDVIGDDSIDIVVEVMGGIEPARTYIKAALEKGKHVVTANKDLMAMHGHELLELAGEHHCDLLFEAAVAGGIPIIRPLKQCLAGNNITEIMGIINGTTNFILTKMKEDGMDFGEALQLATDLGYAEADPTADIEGYDAGRKLAIMASIAFHTSVTFDDVFTEGITKITAKDMRYAKEMGCSIKLLGIAKNTETGIEVKVHPTMIPENHPLAAVNDSFNAVFVHGDAVDPALLCLLLLVVLGFALPPRAAWFFFFAMPTSAAETPRVPMFYVPTYYTANLPSLQRRTCVRKRLLTRRSVWVRGWGCVFFLFFRNERARPP